MSHKLWDLVKELKEDYEWVDLSHEVSPNTPHWDGFPDMSLETVYDYDTTIFQSHKYTIVGQYGTHVDPPIHFYQPGRTLDTFGPKDMLFPLCVIDITCAVEKDCDYALTVQDILDWEEKYGTIPEGAFVAMRSDWCKRGTSEGMDNRDSEGQKHYPGWSVDALKFLVEQRKVGSVGHETSDTDPAVLAPVNNYAGEYYILSQDRFQIELLKNLDQCTPVGSIIFCTFPKIAAGSGFTARCFALVPR